MRTIAKILAISQPKSLHDDPREPRIGWYRNAVAR